MSGAWRNTRTASASSTVEQATVLTNLASRSRSYSEGSAVVNQPSRSPGAPWALDSDETVTTRGDRPAADTGTGASP